MPMIMMDWGTFSIPGGQLLENFQDEVQLTTTEKLHISKKDHSVQKCGRVFLYAIFEKLPAEFRNQFCAGCNTIVVIGFVCADRFLGRLLVVFYCWHSTMIDRG